MVGDHLGALQERFCNPPDSFDVTLEPESFSGLAVNEARSGNPSPVKVVTPDSIGRFGPKWPRDFGVLMDDLRSLRCFGCHNINHSCECLKTDFLATWQEQYEDAERMNK